MHVIKGRLDLQWTIDFYRNEKGVSHVLNFLESIQDKKLKAKILKDIQLLGQLGSDLKMPHAKYIEDGIWELRTKQSTNISRILYFTFKENKIILLTGFVKKTQKTPRQEILRAKEYREDHIRRFENEF